MKIRYAQNVGRVRISRKTPPVVFIFFLNYSDLQRVCIPQHKQFCAETDSEKVAVWDFI